LVKNLLRYFKIGYNPSELSGTLHEDPCCATNRKIAGSIPGGVIGIFHLHNPSDRTMGLGSTQPLTEMSTMSISWGVITAGA